MSKHNPEMLTELGRAIVAQAKTSRDFEHIASQDCGLARASTVAKRVSDPVPIHSHMASRTSTSIGAPPTGAPPDASSPNPVDPEKQHGDKLLPIPAIAWGMNNDRLRGHHDPALADQVMGEAHRDATDHTRLGKKTIPQSTDEN